MNKDLIITIFVSPTGQGKEGKIGTGYPIAEDLILTSRHTIDGGGREIQVRWHHYYCTDEDALDKCWITLSADDIVWKGEGALDAVLLRCPRPKKAQGTGWGRITDKKPPSNESWQSQGFPRATRCENVRHPDDVSGTTESMADQADYFVLNVTSPPKDIDMWRGASGMPVFVHGEIFGVVNRVPENFNGKKLYAVPCWKMFENKEFVKLIRSSQENSLTKDIINIEEMFKKNKIDNYDMAIMMLRSLCENEKKCKEFDQRAKNILQKYTELEKNKINGVCKLSMYKIEKEEIRINSLLLLIDIKIFFNIKSACIKHKKEILNMEAQYNVLHKRKIKLEDELLTKSDAQDNKRLEDILECLCRTIKYLHNTIKSFFSLIEKIQVVEEEYQPIPKFNFE